MNHSEEAKCRGVGDILNPLEEILHWVKIAAHKLLPYKEEIVFNNLALNTPPPHIKGDYTLPIFAFGESFYKDHADFAKRIVEYYSKDPCSLVKKIYAIGPYINIEVNKKPFYKKILEYINNQGNLFGTYQQGNPQLVSINYLSDDLRSSIIGQAIGRLYKYGGHIVFQNDFMIEDSQLIPIGRKIINDALRCNIAKNVNNTNVVMTSPIGKSSSVVLQKQDKSPATNALYLAHTKRLIDKQQPSTLIYISSTEREKMAESLIDNLKLLKYIRPTTNVSTIVTFQMNTDTYDPEEYPALQYAILRIPNNKKVLLTKESLSVYPRLTTCIRQLHSARYRKTQTGNFDLAKLLISFPTIIANVTHFHALNSLCLYLEKVANLCEKQSVCNKDIQLSSAAATVLQNGLSLFISAPLDILNTNKSLAK